MKITVMGMWWEVAGVAITADVTGNVGVEWGGDTEGDFVANDGVV